MGAPRKIVVGDIWIAEGKEVEITHNSGHGLITFCEVVDRTRTPLIRGESDFRKAFSYARTLDGVTGE
jgi:hypothetical protein